MYAGFHLHHGQKVLRGGHHDCHLTRMCWQTPADVDLLG